MASMGDPETLKAIDEMRALGREVLQQQARLIRQLEAERDGLQEFVLWWAERERIDLAPHDPTEWHGDMPYNIANCLVCRANEVLRTDPIQSSDDPSDRTTQGQQLSHP